MLWYTVGRNEDFSAYGTRYGQTVNATNSAYARYAPYYSVKISNDTVRKDLDTPLSGIYVAFDVVFESIGYSSPIPIFYLLTADFKTNLLYLSMTDTTNNIFSVYVNGAVIGTFRILGIKAINQIEVHFVPDATAGIAQIWMNGELLVNYNGNTGNATQKIGSVRLESNAYAYNYFSNVVISDNPIGNKIPIFLTMVDTATVAAGVQLATPGTEYLADVVDLPALPVVAKVTSVRITAQIIAGDGVSNADWELNVDGTTTAVTQSLPTTSAYKSAQIEGNWTPAQINGAKIGIKAEA